MNSAASVGARGDARLWTPLFRFHVGVSASHPGSVDKSPAPLWKIFHTGELINVKTHMQSQHSCAIKKKKKKGCIFILTNYFPPPVARVTVWIWLMHSPCMRNSWESSRVPSAFPKRWCVCPRIWSCILFKNPFYCLFVWFFCLN